MTARALAFVAMLGLLLTTRPLAPSAETNAAMGFTYARAPYAFSFPRDHGSHPSYRTEWWYYTGHLATADGRRFGYELTFFRFGLRPGDPQPTATQSKWRGNQVYPAHFAITDVAGNSFFYVERFAREGLGMGSAAEGKLDVRADDWTLTGAPDGGHDRERMVLHARDLGPSGTNAIDIVQIPEKSPRFTAAAASRRNRRACRARRITIRIRAWIRAERSPSAVARSRSAASRGWTTSTARPSFRPIKRAGIGFRYSSTTGAN
jgi:hypothetical protein